ncbi:hypothetical protein GCM10009579_28870 [Streptomyces javensis]|uniref:Uncharacterized protein n=1 Tax=Streptomyces javensis TaxID=114698 RepID=A0ABN1WVV7_9ACTN
MGPAGVVPDLTGASPGTGLAIGLNSFILNTSGSEWNVSFDHPNPFDHPKDPLLMFTHPEVLHVPLGHRAGRRQ